MKKIVLLNSDLMGPGNEELGRTLMGSFLRKLQVNKTKPDAIILYNSAVKLIAQGSPVLDAMEALFEAGVNILTCGTCIGFFNLKDKVLVGRVSNMQEIVGLIMEAEQVITI